jgi:hypothetical protein
LNQIRVYLQLFFLKTEKKRSKRPKIIKGSRGSISTQTRKRPTAQPAPPPEMVSPLFSSFADEWDPHISTDVVFNLRPKISLEDSVISSY